MYLSFGFPSSMVVKNPPTNARDTGAKGLISGSERSPGNPLQYSCLDNSLDRGAWWVTVHGVSKSRTRLSTQSCKFSLCLEISEYLPITQDPFPPSKGPESGRLGSSTAKFQGDFYADRLVPDYPGWGNILMAPP